MATKKKSQKKSANLPLCLILGCVAVISVLFCIVLGKLNVLPTRYFVAVCILMAVILLVLFLLLRNFKGSFRCVLGVILTILFCAGLCYGGFVMKRASDTLDKVSTSTTVTVSEINVYVRADDAAQSVEDIAAYTLGIIDEQDRDITDKALTQLASQLGTTLKVATFTSPVTLVRGLLDGQVDAILMNSAFFSLVSSNESFATLNTDLRQLTTLKVEVETTVVEEVSDDGENTGDTQTSKHSKKTSRKSGNDDKGNDNKGSDGSIFTVYITGVDQYGDISTVGRGDVNILAVVNSETHQVLLVSTPRDYYIPLANSNGNCDKLTHAAIYGVDNSMDTLAMLYDIDIDYYFRINFSGFEDVIDAIGGVTVDNDISFSTADGCYFPAGEIELDGASGLSYVRERHAFPDGDFTRGRHQMMVIKAAAKKVLSPEILANFSDLMYAIEGNFEMSIPSDLLTSLVQTQLSDGGDWNIVQYSVGGYVDWRTCWSYGDGLSVVTPDYDTVDIAMDLMQDVIDGKTPVIPEN